MASACLVRSGSAVAAKNAITGNCPAISSCQRCAAVPSSASRAVPETAMWPSTSASAASDMAMGRKALGRLSVDKLGSGILGGDVGDRRLHDLFEALATVALEHPHPLVELGARVVDVRLHALAERPLLLLVPLPELGHDAQRRREQPVHVLVHHVPAAR